MKGVSKTIKELMVNRGKKQKDLADFLGISESNLSQLLRRGTLNYETMIKIAKFLNVDLTMFNRDGTKSSQMHIEKNGPNVDESIENLERIILSQSQTIESLKLTIESQKELIQSLRDQLIKK